MINLNDIIVSITDTPYSEIKQTIPSNYNQNLIHGVYENIIDTAVQSAKSNAEPWLLNTSGIPGSGKSTYIENHQSNYKNCVIVAFDTIMENPALPYAREAMESQLTAFKRWELPSRIAGYELLRRLVAQKKNIVFEHSSSIKEHVSLFETLMSSGYEVHYKYLDITISEAERRIANRERKVPHSYLEDRKKALDTLRKTYKKICSSYEIIKQP